MPTDDHRLGAPEAEIEVTPEMVVAAEREIERYLAYSTEAAAIDVEAVLIAALRAKNAASRTVEVAATK